MTRRIGLLSAVVFYVVSSAGCGDSQVVDCAQTETKMVKCGSESHKVICGEDGTWPVTICNKKQAPDSTGSVTKAKGSAILQFDQKSKVVLDSKWGLIWQREVENTKRTRDAAIAYCADLVIEDHKYGKLSEWRLPQRDELETIVLTTTTDPAIDLQAFPDTPSAPFWSRTLHNEEQKQGVGVDFKTGGSGYQYFTEKFHVRCVH